MHLSAASVRGDQELSPAFIIERMKNGFVGQTTEDFEQTRQGLWENVIDGDLPFRLLTPVIAPPPTYCQR
jgi:hypothetical protein